MQQPPQEDDTRYRSTGIVIHLLTERELLRVLSQLDAPDSAVADILAAILEVQVAHEQYDRRN